MEASAKCKSFAREEERKACPALASVCPTNTKRITAVILATSSSFREPVQRLIDLAKNMCIYCIAASVQHACTDLKIMLKTWIFQIHFSFLLGGSCCFFLTLKRPNHFIGWGRRVSLVCRPYNFLVIASLLHKQGE